MNSITSNPSANPVIRSFTDLVAWQEGHKLLTMVYNIMKKIPSEEKYGLIKQLRTAAVSITANIAEGFSRKSYAEKLQFYSISLGSLTEVQNGILIVKDVGYITNEDFQKIAAQAVRASEEPCVSPCAAAPGLNAGHLHRHYSRSKSFS